MSLDLLPSEYAAQLAIGAIRPWTGHHAGSAGLFEVRPRHIPRDVRPVFDEDLDCIIGYHRVFRERCYLYDLTGDMAAIWEGMKDLPPPAQHDTLLVAGGLWAANVRGMTALGIAGSGVALAPTTLAQLRKRFAGLTQVPLHFTEAAHASMDDARRFVPPHILRLAMRLGQRGNAPAEWPGAARYLARMSIMQLPCILDLVTVDDGTVVQFRHWRYAETRPDDAWPAA